MVGASGFVGKNLLSKVSRPGNEIVATYNANLSFPSYVKSLRGDVTPQKCDLRNEEEVKRLLEDFRDFDRCVYLSSDTRVAYLSANPQTDVINNILTTANFVKHYSGGPVVFFSSGAVYMGQEGKVSHESLRPTIPYAISKLASEFYLSQAKEFKHTIIRFFGAYGPYEPERKITRKLIRLLQATVGDQEFTVYGDGNNLIDVMHVDDAVNAIEKVFSSKRTDATVDLCGGSPCSINEYVQRIARIFGRTVRLFHSGFSAEYIQFFASNEEFYQNFGFRPSTSLEDGIKSYSNWLAQQSIG